MLTRCRCGCSSFRPIGIQGGWKGRGLDNAPKVLYLVNCVDCGTTRSCDRLQYALLQSREASRLLQMEFFSSGQVAA